MSLELKINVCSKNCNSLVFKELTGAYSASNLTGWNTPNELLSNAILAQLEIITPSNITYTINVFTSGFPTTDIIKEYIIKATDIGYTDKLPDGKYQITYNISTNTSNYTKQVTYYNTCNISCCIDNMLASIEDVTCDCSKEQLDKYIEAYSVYIGLKHKLICGTVENFDQVLKYLNSLCNNKCKNC